MWGGCGSLPAQHDAIAIMGDPAYVGKFPMSQPLTMINPELDILKPRSDVV